ncbi:MULTISPECIES: PP2C family serine/threonine-protein phosphatase [unclassified Micromonospora]|uniref:PP2C family protein-serine/threonine phosphatase n=1 Tax=unclassified Micromonospora TaxID=2617518 RepID=UPI001034327E|nr:MULTISPECIES: PP2C family serine/threonine-protein phosphatase [unclassified Micromonospora]QKW11562.1 serine/threonine-protein phosphatase [Verrucosispora sp. NA02020]QKW11686.1 serine/threonine-protein phosphatase [Verrucosispora sp. NA02020]TBL27728.1 serine/threonine-protein phosphatase [Verrucosispora sp. SN26_14.1]
MTLILRSAILNDIGLVRTNNEDSALAGERLVAVADGMGGLPAGEVASEIVIRILDELIPPTAPDAATDSLRAVVSTANQRIHAAIAAEPARDGMGTTLTAALLAGDTLVLAQVGDSRCYLLREGRLRQLTRDDTFVQALVDQGTLTREQARHHPQRSLVTRAVQGADAPPTMGSVNVAAGDRLLLCSDGLSDYVTDDAIAAALSLHTDRHQCGEQLVKLAHQAGAPDNVTVVISDVVPS